MTQTGNLIKRIESLVEREEYKAALEYIDNAGDPDDVFEVPSAQHRRWLILSSKALYFNQDYRKAADLLSELESKYPLVESDTDFIFIRSQLLLIEGNPREALDTLERSLSERRPRDEQFLLRFCLGKAYFWNGDYLNANLVLEACRQFYETSGDQLMLGNVLYMLGYTAFQRSFFDHAESYYHQAIERFSRSGKNGQLAAVYHMMGILAYRTGRYSNAEDFLSKARRYFGKADNRVGKAESNIAIGRVKMYLGDLSEASKMMEKGYELSLNTGYRRGMALAREFLGEIACIDGDHIRAEEYLTEALELASEMSPEGDVMMEVQRRLGDLHIAAGRIEDAPAPLARAMDLAKRLNDDHELGCVLRALAKLQAERGGREFARSYFAEAVSVFRIIKESFELAGTYRDAAEIYSGWAADCGTEPDRRKELLDLARTYSTEAAHLFDSLGLSGPAAACEKTASRILSEHYGEKKMSRLRGLRFEESWLYGGFVVARSAHMRRIVDKAVSLAPENIPVLLTGETGTGKEVVARLIHAMSLRPSGRFVAVNCASIPDTVFESELFGHRKGSFTGADRDHVGLIEKASGGTLFLDEISELTAAQQAKLLRVFQESSIRRIGESHERPVDVRLISASNQNIQAILRSGRLRKDFYYRVLTASIDLEPLRRRRDDIEALFSYNLINTGFEGEVEEGVFEFLKGYHWPGNVRELISVARVLSLIGEGGGVIRKNDLPLKIRNHHILGEHIGSSLSSNLLKMREIPSIGLVKDREEIRQLIVSSLVRCNGNKSSAARELGISRSTLYRAMKSLDIL